MLSNGYSLSFKDNHRSIYEPQDSLIARVDKSFPLNWNELCNRVTLAQKDESLLWHRRSGHFNYIALKNLHSRGLTKDLSEMSMVEDVLSSCQLGKMHRKSFPNYSSWTAQKKLELVHIDVCGPTSVELIEQ